MLRISVVNEPGVTRFKLEGKLAHEWVGEAEALWTSLESATTKVVVDLFDVSFVDDLGAQLLTHMQRNGAKLLGSGPMISALIEEIESAPFDEQVLKADVAELGFEGEIEQ